MPAGSVVDALEKALKKRYGAGNKHAIYGTLNKRGFMHGNKTTKKGRKKVTPGSMLDKLARS